MPRAARTRVILKLARAKDRATGARRQLLLRAILVLCEDAPARQVRGSFLKAVQSNG